MKAGINLFTLRTFMQSEADFLSTANKLKDMGYSYVQFSGCPYDADMIKRVSNESGLPVVLTHVPIDRIINDTEALMEEHSSFGCKNIGLGMMPIDCFASEAACKNKIEELNLAGEKMAKSGFRFFYHHHHYEFHKFNNQTIFDYMIENAKNINFTVDTYWLQYGGVDIYEYLEKLNARIECIHLKDYKIKFTTNESGKISAAPEICALGDGTIDFKRVVDIAKKSGAKYFLVEQDNAPTFDDPFEQVQRSINYIKAQL